MYNVPSLLQHTRNFCASWVIILTNVNFRVMLEVVNGLLLTQAVLQPLDSISANH